jgi:hypothetical protein
VPRSCHLPSRTELASRDHLMSTELERIRSMIAPKVSPRSSSTASYRSAKMPIPKFGLAYYQDMLFGTERVLWWLCSRLDLPRLIRYDRRTVAEKTATESQVVRNAMFAIEKRTRDTALKRYYGRKILAGEGDLLL